MGFRSTAILALAASIACGGADPQPSRGDAGPSGQAADGGSGDVSPRASTLRFTSVPAGVVAGEPFQLDIAIEDQFGNPFNPPTAVTLTVLSHFNGVTLQATPVNAAPGVARFTAALDRESLGVILVAATGGLQAKSGPIDVRATRVQADWRLVGVEGTSLRSFFALPPDPLSFMAVDIDHRQLFVTADGGASWTRPPAAGLPAEEVLLSVAACPDGSVYANIHHSGLYRSRDHARSFERIHGGTGLLYCDASGARPFLLQNSGPVSLLRWDGTAFAPIPNPGVGSISAAPDGQTFFATTGSSGVLRSTDGAATWSPTALTHDAAILLAVSSEVALAIGANGALRRTADGGATWSLLFDHGITSVSPAPKGALIALGDGGVMRRSADGGATWTSPAKTVAGQLVLWIVENDAGTWIATPSAVYVLDGGSFRIATAGMGGLRGSVFSDPSTGFVYAGSPVGLYRFGRSRAPELIFDGFVRGVTFDPSSPGAMFADTWDGFFRSADSGSTWSRLPGAPALPLASPDGHTWYANGGGLWRSDDAGSNWSRLWEWDIGRPRITAMAFDKGAILFASGADTSKVFGGVFRSDDGGKTYTQVKRGMTFQIVTAGSSLVVPAEVSRTDDFGRTFTPLFSGHELVKWVAASARDPRVLIALEQPAPGGLPPALYRTSDGGATWTRCLSGLEHPEIFQVELDPADGTTLYAATDQGLFRSSNACPAGH